MLNKVNIFKILLYELNKKPVLELVQLVVHEKCCSTSSQVISLKKHFEISPNDTLETTEPQNEGELYNKFLKLLDNNCVNEKLPTNQVLMNELNISLKKVKELKAKACENKILIKVSANLYHYNINCENLMEM